MHRLSNRACPRHCISFSSAEEPLLLINSAPFLQGSLWTGGGYIIEYLENLKLCSVLLESIAYLTLEGEDPSSTESLTLTQL